VETRKRSTRLSTSLSASAGRRTKRRGKKAIAASSGSRPQHEESEPVITLFGEDWLQDPNCVGSSIAALGQDLSDWSNWSSWTTERYTPGSVPEHVDEQNNNYDPHLIRWGDAIAQDANLVDTMPQGGEQGQIIERARIDSEEYMTARLLYAIHEE